MLDEAMFTAGDLMTRDVAVVHPETSLLEAVKLMAQRRISGMPVVDETDSIVGMVSEGDLLRWHEGHTERQAKWLDMLAEGADLAPSFLERIKDQHRKVKSVMVSGAITVAEDTAAREVARLIDQLRREKVPAVFGSEVFPSKVLYKIASEAGVRYVTTLRDDVLPGAPGEMDHSYMGMMRQNVTTMLEALGGTPATFATCLQEPATR